MLISYRLPSTFSPTFFATRILLVAVVRPNVAIDIVNFYSKDTRLILTLLALELKFTL